MEQLPFGHYLIFVESGVYVYGAQIAIAQVSYMDTNGNVQLHFSLEYNSVDQKVIFVAISFPLAVPPGTHFTNMFNFNTVVDRLLHAQYAWDEIT